MFAVIKTGGKQFRVQVGDVLDVEKLDLEAGKKVTFDNVLLIEDEKNTLIGTPVVEKAQVVGEVIENLKDKKVLVFKKKRRKQYRKMTGHRQMLTRIKIEKILSGADAPVKKKAAEMKIKPEEELKKLEAEVAKKKPAAKKAEPKAAEPKKPEKKPEPAKPKPEKTGAKKAKSAPAKAAAPKKKPAAKKPAAEKVASKDKKTTSKKEK
jgi:large subunit ribosomal protein L21